MDCGKGVVGTVSSTAGNVADVATGLSELFPVNTITKIIEFIELILSPAMTHYILMSTGAVTAVWVTSVFPSNILGQVIIILLAWSNFVEAVRFVYPTVEGVAQLLAIPLKKGLQITGKQYQVTSWAIFVVLTMVGLATRVNIIVPLFIAGRLIVTYYIWKYMNAKKTLENIIPTPGIPSMDTIPTPPLPSLDAVPTPPLPSMDGVPTPPIPSVENLPAPSLTEAIPETPTIPFLNKVPTPPIPSIDVPSVPSNPTIDMKSVPEVPTIPSPSKAPMEQIPESLKHVPQPDKVVGAVKPPSLF